MQYPYIDMHCDTLLQCVVRKNNDLYGNGETMVNVDRMFHAGQGAQFFAVFFPPQPEKGEGFDDDELFNSAAKILDDTVKSHPDKIAMALTADDISAALEQGKTCAVLTIEDARAVNGSLDRLKYFHDRGVRAMSLTWNGENCFGSPNSADPQIMASPLKPFGREAIQAMNRLGILIDVSHLSDGGFYDVAHISKKPFVATHSNCRSLCRHQRNLTDDMIRTLASAGGAAGLNFCPQFINDDANCTHSDVNGLVRHVVHMLNVGGEDFPALGTDFDGIEGTFDISHPEQMHLLFEALEKAGLTQRQIEKFAYGNVLRVLKDTI
jgi:membrane dipeptidase